MRFAVVLSCAVLLNGSAVAEPIDAPACNIPKERVLADVATAELHVIATLTNTDATRFLDASNGPDDLAAPSVVFVDSLDGASVLVLVFDNDCLNATARFTVPALNKLLGRIKA